MSDENMIPEYELNDFMEDFVRSIYEDRPKGILTAYIKDDGTAVISQRGFDFNGLSNIQRVLRMEELLNMIEIDETYREAIKEALEDD